MFKMAGVKLETFEKFKPFTKSLSLRNQASVQGRRLLYGLVMASSVRERLSVLKIAIITFDHNIMAVHDELCLRGSISILLACLQRATLDKGYDDLHLKEIDLTCQLLRMNFRCSIRNTQRVFRSIGTELLLLLFSIQLYFQENNKSSRRFKGTSLRLLVRHLAKIEVSLCDMQMSDKLLRFLQQIILRAKEDKKLMKIASDASLVLAGLTIDGDSTLFAMQLPGFTDNVIVIAQNAEGYDIEVQQAVAKILQNLAWHQQNKFTLVKTAKNIKAILTLIKDTREIGTRVKAVQTFRHLSVEAENKLSLVKYGEGKVLHSLLNAMDGNPELQELSIETLLNFACHETSLLMGRHPGLIQKLQAIASTSSNVNRLAPIKASQIIKRLATHISVTERCHPALLNALMSLSDSKDKRVRYWASKAYAEQARLSGSSFFLVRAPEALNQLTQLAKDDCMEVKANAMEAFLILTASQSNAKRLYMNSDLLNTFVKIVDTKKKCTAARSAGRSAVQALMLLASTRSAKKRMAKQLGVVASLSRYGVSQDADVELKQAALHTVIVLAPLM